MGVGSCGVFHCRLCYRAWPLDVRLPACVCVWACCDVQCNDFSMSIVEDSMIGRASDAVTEASTIGSTPVPLNISADAYFKIAPTDTLPPPDDVRPSSPKRSRQDHRPAVEAAPFDFKTATLDTLQHCLDRDDAGVPVSLRCMTDLLLPAARYDTRMCYMI